MEFFFKQRGKIIKINPLVGYDKHHMIFVNNTNAATDIQVVRANFEFCINFSVLIQLYYSALSVFNL